MSEKYIRIQDAVGVIEEKMENYVSDIWYKSATHSALNDVSEDIKSLEPADVVPAIHSEWEYHMSFGVCRNCGYEYNWTGTDAKNYCPNCGAIMDGKGEE